jgi:hypothetical protein
MKWYPYTLFALISLLGCSYHTLPPVGVLPAREIHFDFETGEQIGVRTFTYDWNGNITYEYYSDARNKLADEETIYDYDGENRLMRKKNRQPEISPIFFMTEWTYENDLKKSETTYLSNSPAGYRTSYFYTNGVMDSTQLFAYSNIDGRYSLIVTTRYAYDSHGRLSKAFNKSSLTVYRYSLNRLVATCNVLGGDDGINFEDCIEQEYNSAGQLVKVSSSNPWHTELREELFYRAGRLDEKRLYSYPSYDPNNRVEVKQIQYDYTD